MTNYFQKLELHYYLGDESHVMDAVVRNEAERELLALFRECLSLLGFEYSIEAEALSEGGLRNIWRIAGSPQAALAVAILTLIMSRFPPTDEQRQQLEAELLQLQAEEARLNIEKLRRELGKEDIDGSGRSSSERAADELVKSSKVLIRRSNFYEKIEQYPKVRAVSFTHLDQEGRPVVEERVVERSNFRLFIVNSKELKPDVVEDAVVEIVSPVLREGNYKWKGIYDGESISFSMTDSTFTYQVRAQQVSFRSGSRIVCVLEIHRKLDEAGKIVITGYSVPTVIRKEDSEQVFDTPQGKWHKSAKKLLEAQGDIFGDDSG